MVKWIAVHDSPPGMNLVGGSKGCLPSSKMVDVLWRTCSFGQVVQHLCVVQNAMASFSESKLANLMMISGCFVEGLSIINILQNRSSANNFIK